MPLPLGCSHLAQLSPCTSLALPHKHHPQPLTAHHLPPRALTFQLCSVGGHRKGLPVSRLIPKAPSQRWVCCWDVTPTRNTQHPADTSSRAQPITTTLTASLPSTHGLPGLPFQSTTVPNLAPTDFLSPRTTQPRHRRQVWGARFLLAPLHRCLRSPRRAGSQRRWEGLGATEIPSLGSRSSPRLSWEARPSAPCPHSPYTDVRTDGPAPAVPPLHPRRPGLGGGGPGGHSPRGRERRRGRWPARIASGPAAG